jgi:hypothetical protein
MATIPYPQSDKAVNRDVRAILPKCEAHKGNGTP